MKKTSETKAELPEEITILKKKIKKLEKSESKQKSKSIELGDSETKYLNLADDMPALICTFLPDSTLTYVNKAYCELFHKQPADLVGKKFLDFLPDEVTRENVRHQYMSLTPENPVKTYEHEVIVSDGTNQYHWHRWTDRAFFNDKREIIHFQSIGQDITDRKLADNELRASERKYRTLTQQMPEMTWQKDVHGVYVSCNSNYADVLGVTIDSIAGHRDEDFYKPELAAKYLADDQSVIATGQSLETEELWEEAGEVRWLHTSKVPLLNDDGNVIGTIGIGHDITERKQTEKALQENEERFRTILKTAQDGFWLMDASNGQLVEYAV